MRQHNISGGHVLHQVRGRQSGDVRTLPLLGFRYRHRDPAGLPERALSHRRPDRCELSHRVTLGHTGSRWSYWVTLGHTGSHWVTLGHTGSHWVILGHTGSHWVTLVTLGHTGSHWVTLGHTGHTGSHWVTLSRTGLHRVTLGHTEPHCHQCPV